MINKILEEIKVKYSNKYILNAIKELEKCNIKSSRSIELISKLGTYMYVNGDFDNSLKVFSMTDKIEFSGNWDIWDNVYTCQILKAKVYSRLGEDDVAEKIKKNLNLKTTGSILNWKSNIDTKCTIPLDGRYNSCIQEALDNNDLKHVLELRVFKLISILKYIEGSVFKDNIYESKVKSANELIEEIKCMLL